MTSISGGGYIKSDIVSHGWVQHVTSVVMGVEEPSILAKLGALLLCFWLSATIAATWSRSSDTTKAMVVAIMTCSGYRLCTQAYLLCANSGLLITGLHTPNFFIILQPHDAREACDLLVQTKNAKIFKMEDQI
jgi:hypothetical protein